jgi:hypothetical protein
MILGAGHSAQFPGASEKKTIGGESLCSMWTLEYWGPEGMGLFEVHMDPNGAIYRVSQTSMALPHLPNKNDFFHYISSVSSRYSRLV